mgnify:CR=1 FL=1
MKQFVLDANKVILASSETTDKVDEVRFEPNEVYTVDIATGQRMNAPCEHKLFQLSTFP